MSNPVQFYSCPSCGGANSEDAAFCASCGIAFPQQPVASQSSARAAYCASCHAMLEEGAAFCGMCGTAAESIAMGTKAQASFCASCGAMLPEQAAFCGECGFAAPSENVTPYPAADNSSLAYEANTNPYMPDAAAYTPPPTPQPTLNGVNESPAQSPAQSPAPVHTFIYVEPPAAFAADLPEWSIEPPPVAVIKRSEQS